MWLVILSPLLRQMCATPQHWSIIFKMFHLASPQLTFLSCDSSNKTCLCCTKGRSTCSNPFSSPPVWCGLSETKAQGSFMAPSPVTRSSPSACKLKGQTVTKGLDCNNRVYGKQTEKNRTWACNTDQYIRVSVINTHTDACMHLNTQRNGSNSGSSPLL